MKNETLLRGLLALASMVLVIMTFEYFEKDRVYQELKLSTSKHIDSLTILSDSLRDENFNLNVELGRDELTFEYQKENFLNIYKLSMNFREHETE
jgi:hypothetical protein